jgi:DNA-binding IclR family transcriptional regulator
MSAHDSTTLTAELVPTAADYSLVGIDRAISVLDALERKGALTLAEVARTSSLNEATALRYLTSLCKHGLVERSPVDGRYRLGIRLFQLGQHALRGRDPRQCARPHMEQLLARFSETVNFGMRHGSELVLIDVLESTQSIKKGATIGDRDHWHASSLGKAILAALDTDVARTLTGSNGLTRCTPQTITSTKALFAQLPQVRQAGYAVDDEESETGLRCIGAAVLDENGEPRYALSIAGPASRVTHERQEEIGQAVQRAAEAVSRELGYTEPPRPEEDRMLTPGGKKAR